jgi:hypothetical protein
MVIGVVEFICINHSQERSFVVLVGICESKAWCEFSFRRGEYSLAEIYYNKIEALGPKYQHDGLLDMAMYWFDSDWWFAASISRLPSHEKGITYALHVQGCSEDQQEPWCSLYLNELRLIKK